MDHKMWYDEGTKLLYLEFTGDFLLKDVPPIREKIFELLDGKPYRQMLTFINKTSKVENRDTREQTNKTLQDASITEIAFVGGSAANRMIAKVLLKTGAIKTQGDFFKKEEDAVKWLKSKR